MNTTHRERVPSSAHLGHPGLLMPLGNGRIRPVLAASSGLLVLVGTWWGVSLVMPAYLLPGPIAVVQALAALTADGGLLTDVGATSFTTLAGLGLGAALALGLAVVFVLYRNVEAAIYPSVIALRSIPAVAAAPLLIIWTGTGIWMKVLVSAFVSFFPILVYVLHGLRGPSQEYVDQFSIWAASRPQVLRCLRLPWAIPAFFGLIRLMRRYFDAGPGS